MLTNFSTVTFSCCTADDRKDLERVEGASERVTGTETHPTLDTHFSPHSPHEKDTGHPGQKQTDSRPASTHKLFNACAHHHHTHRPNNQPSSVWWAVRYNMYQLVRDLLSCIYLSCFVFIPLLCCVELFICKNWYNFVKYSYIVFFIAGQDLSEAKFLNWFPLFL